MNKKPMSKWEMSSYVLALLAIVVPYAMVYERMIRYDKMIITVTSSTWWKKYNFTVVIGYRQFGDTEKKVSVDVAGVQNVTLAPGHTYYLELRGRRLLNLMEIE